MNLNNLVGFQLSELNNDYLVVKKGDNLYTIDFDCEQGDCCGYSSVKSDLLFDKENLSNNPVITKIVTESVDGDYYSASVLITLFGEYKPMAKISAEAGSGSGWCYGAAVTVRCKPLHIEEEIVGW